MPREHNGWGKRAFISQGRVAQTRAVLRHRRQEQEAVIEEFESAELVEEGEAAHLSLDTAWTKFLRTGRKYAFPTAQEEKDLAARVERGDTAARSIMILSNLRLVAMIAKRYLSRGLNYSDIVAEGNIGLIKAVDRFKLAKECRFSTYAFWWIRQSIERALDHQSRMMRLPVDRSIMMRKIARATRELMQELKGTPSAEEVAGRLGEELPKVLEVMAQVEEILSLDQRMGSTTEELSLCEIIEDFDGISPLELLENLDEYAMVSRFFNTLTVRERKVLTMRFGLADQPPETLETIGRSLNVTRERARQIESEALQKLKRLVHTEVHGKARAGS